MITARLHTPLSFFLSPRFSFRPARLVVACGVLLATPLAVRAQMLHSDTVRAAKKTPPSSAEKAAPSNTQLADKHLNSRIDDLLGQMTLEEKIGQLVQYSYGEATGPNASKEDYTGKIAKGQIGSLLNVVNAQTANRLQHIAMEKSRLHIPMLFGDDVIHGDRTIFPVPLALAASFDPAMVEQASRMAATEARADGIQWVFSPMVDIARDGRWGRIVESSGEDPYLGSALGSAYIRGYQQDDLGKAQSVAACVKHFAAYGAPIAGRDYNGVELSEWMLRDVYLKPYQAAVEAGAASLMSSFNTLNGVPASANPFILTQVLRREWGFNGFVVSDWNAVGELLAHGVALDGATAAQRALNAGVDMDMMSGIYTARLMGLVESGAIPQSVVDEAVRRVLRVKLALGLFEHPYTPQSPAYVATAEKRAVARKAAEETIVLLKNQPVEGLGPVLPLKKVRTLALIGPLADSQADMLGSWIAQGNAKDAVTLKSALEQRAATANAKVLYAKGTEIRGDSTAGFEEAVNAAKQADVAILALGEAGNMTGEATSRAHLDLPGNQQQLLEAVAAAGKPVVLIVFNGHPLVLNWPAAHVPAMLEAWFPGIEAGPALADILFGDASPSGHLPVSLPRAVGQEPLYYAQASTGRPVEGIDLSHPPANPAEQYTSRYIDEDNAPLFPFGFGLSYTRFSYSEPTLNTQQIPISTVDGARGQSTALVTVGVDVKNTGAVAGSDVVQLYLRKTGATMEEPLRELKGFARVTLAPGEQKHIDFPLGWNELSYYFGSGASAELHRGIEPVKVDVWVGGDSTATQHAAFQITK